MAPLILQLAYSLLSALLRVIYHCNHIPGKKENLCLHERQLEQRLMVCSPGQSSCWVKQQKVLSRDEQVYLLYQTSHFVLQVL